MSRVPRLQIYRPLEYPGGELATILETELNSLGEFEPELVNQVLTPLFIPRIKLMSFDENKRLHKRADMPVLRTGLEELASHVEYSLSEVGGDETIPNVQILPFKVHGPKDRPWKQTITVAHTARVARQRRGVKKYAREFVRDSSGVNVDPAKVWISDAEATGMPIARSANTQEALVIDRLAEKIGATLLKHGNTANLLPTVYDVTY